MMCSMCPTVTFSNSHAPGKGWQCECREVNCSHMLRCPKCGANRYQLEKAGRLKNGLPVSKSGGQGEERESRGTT